MKKSPWLVVLCISLVFLGYFSISCEEATEPSYTQFAVLEGTPYERGLQHGTQFKPLIRSLYTRLLTTSILPYLNREQGSIAPVLPEYNKPEYREGKFSYVMVKESGHHLYENFLSDAQKDEMRGIADGADMELDEILILNTFFDTMMGFRGIVSFIQGIQDPEIKSLWFDTDLTQDGFDNDGSGIKDNSDEGPIDPYQTSFHAVMVEVPTDAPFHMVLEDLYLPGFACMDPRNLTPMAEFEIESECVDLSCIQPEFQNLDSFRREHFTKEALNSCLEPRIGIECLDIYCAEAMDPGCVNPDSIRIQMNDTLYVAGDDAIEWKQLEGSEATGDGLPEDHPYRRVCNYPLEVTFFPPEGWPEASEVSLLIQAGDQSPVYSPEPYHNRYMRDERIVFTTKGFYEKEGYGKVPSEVENRGAVDPNSQPTSIAFAVRNSATKDGDPIMAHHYALLDSDMVHEHSILFVHKPDDGYPHVVLGFAGLIWGFAGMNSEGLSFGFTNSDTLDNPLVGVALNKIYENIADLLENPDLVGLSAAMQGVKMLAEGIPAGMIGRDVLAHYSTVDEAAKYIHSLHHSYGWNFLLADAEGGMVAIEVDSAVLDNDEHPDFGDRDGFMYYTPEEGNPEDGPRWASVGDDDLRISSHYQKNVVDIPPQPIMSTFEPPRQMFWTGYFLRSLRTFYVLGDQIKENYSNIDVAKAIEILQVPDLVDKRDSMSAAVFEPKKKIVHWSLGVVPASDGPFTAFDLGAFLEEGGAK